MVVRQGERWDSVIINERIKKNQEPYFGDERSEKEMNSRGYRVTSNEIGVSKS